VNASLIELFKGELELVKGAKFEFTVEQKQESGGGVSDYYGLWTHVELETHAAYLIIAQAETRSAATLLKEENCRAVLDRSYFPDAEAYRSSRNADSPDAVIEIAQERRTVVKDYFERYLWARVQADFKREQEALLPLMLSLASAEDATTSFRMGLIGDLYTEAVNLEPDPMVTQAIVRQFFRILLQESAQSFAPHLVEVELYNLTVREGHAQLPVEEVFPTRTGRQPFLAALAKFPTERAREIERWLSR
jgi:hypothetical protein